MGLKQWLWRYLSIAKLAEIKYISVLDDILGALYHPSNLSAVPYCKVDKNHSKKSLIYHLLANPNYRKSLGVSTIYRREHQEIKARLRSKYMSYQTHIFALANGDKVGLQYKSGFDGNGMAEHTYTLTSHAGKTYTAQPPLGVIKHDGTITQNLGVRFFNTDVLFCSNHLDIGFEHGNNTEVYKALKAEFERISKPKFKGYNELKALMFQHDEYKKYLDSVSTDRNTVIKEKPRDYNQVAEQYPEAHIYIQARKIQTSGSMDKFREANEVIKRLLLGHCVKSIQMQVDSWEVPDDIAT